MKYDSAYRHLLTSRWRRADPALTQMSKPARSMRPGISLTPEPSSGAILPPIGRHTPGLASRGSAASRSATAKLQKTSTPGKQQLHQTLRGFDKARRGTVTIEQLQQGLVELNMVPAASNDVILDLFKSCDRDGNGNIEYDELMHVIQEHAAAGK